MYVVSMVRSTNVATWERLVRYHRATTEQMDQHLQDMFGHSLDDYDVLHQVALNGDPIRMGDLADRLLVANSSCHRIVTRLVAAGLLERSHGVDDGRVVLVELTAKGRRLQRHMATVHTRDIEESLNARLAPGELETLDDIMQHLLPLALAADSSTRPPAAADDLAVWPGGTRVEPSSGIN